MPQPWFGIFSLLLLTLLLMASCTAYTPPPPPQQEAVRTVAKPDAAYRQAYTLFAQQPGWGITWADAGMHTFRGDVNNAARLQVSVQDQQGCSLVSVTGAVMPNKITTGRFTEVQDYAQQLREKLPVCPQVR